MTCAFFSLAQVLGGDQRRLVGRVVVRVDRERHEPVVHVGRVDDPDPDRLDAVLGEGHAELPRSLLVRGDGELHRHAVRVSVWTRCRVDRLAVWTAVAAAGGAANASPGGATGCDAQPASAADNMISAVSVARHAANARANARRRMPTGACSGRREIAAPHRPDFTSSIAGVEMAAALPSGAQPAAA